MRAPAFLLACAAAALSAGAAFAGTVRIDGWRGSFLAEPEIAVNPLDPLDVLVVSKDMTPRRGLRSIHVYVSTDGGRSFGGRAVVSGSYLRAPADATDPVAVFDRAGRAFFGQIVWRYPGKGFESLVGVRRSVDGGATFGAPVAVVRTFNARVPYDFGLPPVPSIAYDKA